MELKKGNVFAITEDTENTIYFITNVSNLLYQCAFSSVNKKGQEVFHQNYRVSKENKFTNLSEKRIPL